MIKVAQSYVDYIILIVINMIILIVCVNYIVVIILTCHYYVGEI